MKTRHIIVFLFILSALLLQACGAGSVEVSGDSAVDVSDSAIQTAIFQTQQISQLQTAAAGGGGGTGGGATVPSDTPFPSNTPTITLTWTPSIPYVMVSSATNCRSGPSSSYTLITTIQVGQQVEVLKNFSNDYVVVRNPNAAGDCWLWLNYANTHDFTPYNLPFATQPPTSTPTFTPTPSISWAGDWNIWIGPAPYLPCTMQITVSGSNLDGTYVCAGFSGEVHGTISADLKTVSGTWKNDSPQNGDFDWSIKKNTSQFIGNYDSSLDWCGARAGASQPSPCYWP